MAPSMSILKPATLVLCLSLASHGFARVARDTPCPEHVISAAAPVLATPDATPVSYVGTRGRYRPVQSVGVRVKAHRILSPVNLKDPFNMEEPCTDDDSTPTHLSEPVSFDDNFEDPTENMELDQKARRELDTDTMTAPCPDDIYSTDVAIASAKYQAYPTDEDLEGSQYAKTDSSPPKGTKTSKPSIISTTRITLTATDESTGACLSTKAAFSSAMTASGSATTDWICSSSSSIADETPSKTSEGDQRSTVTPDTKTKASSSKTSTTKTTTPTSTASSTNTATTTKNGTTPAKPSAKLAGCPQMYWDDELKMLTACCYLGNPDNDNFSAWKAALDVVPCLANMTGGEELDGATDLSEYDQCQVVNTPNEDAEGFHETFMCRESSSDDWQVSVNLEGIRVHQQSGQMTCEGIENSKMEDPNPVLGRNDDKEMYPCVPWGGYGML